MNRPALNSAESLSDLVIPKKSLLLVLFYVLGLPFVSAAQTIDQIAEVWTKRFGDFPQRETYHYRCEMQRTTARPGARLNNSEITPSGHHQIEIFRSGDASRMDIVSEPEAPSIVNTGWSYIFDGHAGFVIMRDSTLCNLYPSSRDREEIEDKTLPFADPLADVLGLSAATKAASFELGLRIVEPDSQFDVAKAVKNARYEIVSSNSDQVRLRDDEGATLTLSVPHDYAIVRRSWTWTLDRPVRCTLKNSDWQQFSDGTWFPNSSQFRCRELSGQENDDELFAIDYSFTAMPPVRKADFQVTATTPGMDIEYRGPGKEWRRRRVRGGDSIDLTAVAHGEVSIRWHDRSEARFSVMQPVNVVPILIISLLLALQPSRHGHRQWQRWSIHGSLFLAVSFLVLVHSAMWFYEGGSWRDRSLTSYSWTLNFLSDLGREFCFNAEDNQPTATLFKLAMSAGGLGLVFYVATLPTSFQPRVSKGFAIVAMICGVVGGWCCVRIAWAPIDTSYRHHSIYVVICFSVFSAMGMASTLAILLDRDYPNRYAGSLLGACLAIGWYLLVRVIHFRDLLPGDWFRTLVVAQKIAVYSLILCTTYQARGTMRMLDRRESESAQDEN